MELVHSTIAGKMLIIDYVTIASTGNAVDFGDFLKEFYPDVQDAKSPTRGVTFWWVEIPPNSATKDIQYNTISTLGNASDFGDLILETIHWSGGIKCCSRNYNKCWIHSVKCS